MSQLREIFDRLLAGESVHLSSYPFPLRYVKKGDVYPTRYGERVAEEDKFLVNVGIKPSGDGTPNWIDSYVRLDYLATATIVKEQAPPTRVRLSRPLFD